MHVLVTRPQPDADDWQRRLEALGVAVTIDPLLTIVLEPPQTLATDGLGGLAGLIVTSRNALRALAQSPVLGRQGADITRLPIYAVGSGTAADARALGFNDVREGPATAKDLVPLILAAPEAGSGHLLHLSGDRLAFDLASAMADRGLRVERQIVYRSRPAESLQAATRAALEAGAIDTVVLLSPLTAETFVGLMTNHGFSDRLQRLRYVCLSHAIADRVRSHAPATVLVAQMPNASSVFSLLEGLAAEASLRVRS
jgi:uroporphyrinogen-III synthase